MEWGEKESQRDAQGRYYPWKRSELRRKLEDAAAQQDPGGRPRGYLLERFALRVGERDVETMFTKQANVHPIADVECELREGTRNEGARVRRITAIASASPSALPPFERGQDDREPDERFRSDRRTAYLWQDNHGQDTNVWPSERRARAKVVLEAYTLVPRQGLLPDFLATYLPTTDCSCTLLLGAGLSLAATFLNRRVWITQGGRRVHPNLWNALIATSGERKSTAVNLVANLLKEDQDYAGICLASDSTWPAIASRLGLQVPLDDNGEPNWGAVREYCQQRPDDWISGRRHVLYRRNRRLAQGPG